MDFLNAFNNFQNRLFNFKVVQLPKRIQYTLKDVSAHCTEDDCWMVIKDLVYNVTDFMREHPGGSDIMLEYAGTDATMAFADKPHSLDAWMILEKYIVGELIPEERMFDKDSSS
ncbi:unnamed protein product [Rotaria sp. Silwood1]|nr:unnamed protein product [Rotaria sp. Silwood1]CAF3400309.1 unnamed protein product [Rotaria sp. Silwood1]CAF3432113.1 unnamed protein product [Rotaria sp. Silwood1]CAF4581851.1 unnamed protein product [Rotaria sp. Silwood1]CAF4607462.1 unnamed protein product [Rotaria sp. Silwood1]